LGVFLERIDPVVFRGFFVDVKFAFVAFEAFAKSEGRPVAGFVNGAFVQLRIAETFGKDGTVSVFFLEMLGKFAQGEGWRGWVGGVIPGLEIAATG
jgi:hypothetical protein